MQGISLVNVDALYTDGCRDNGREEDWMMTSNETMVDQTRWRRLILPTLCIIEATSVRIPSCQAGVICTFAEDRWRILAAFENDLIPNPKIFFKVFPTGNTS